ncbi:hypothetical protein RHSIM_RhsimUnG0074200 [Rhododendron simsii]|uniref:Transposase n=1 Tax=Rhododendron simsii TaxID=118357 RepID=A0A834FYB6_RHOSS|nr:hypothetical protein RHSIM_RhsimUnG0074200 [Rhododendron simsii]
MDKDWMAIKNRWSEQYKQGVESFIEFAMANSGAQAKIRCPCIDCLNSKTLSSEVVRIHLMLKGIDSSYKTWVYHGEPVPVRQPQTQYEDYHEQNEGIGDETGREVPEDDNQLRDMLEQSVVGGILDDDVDGLPNLERENVRNFEKLFNAAQCKAYPGCAKTVLAFVVKMLHVKVFKKLGNETFDMIMKIIKEMLPVDREIESTIPWNIYDAKKFLRDLGLGYIPIHACKYDCALFWKENANLENCPTCNEPRYKVNDETGKKIPHKILRYLPLTPRLQRLYYCKKTAPDMRWHKDKRVDDEELRHPADGQEWKDFDEHFPNFAAEPRNVRLGMATDGFNPFGNMSTSYSMWPVIMVPYNLPPWKCMKEPFLFMSLLIPGPSAIGRDIDVYLRPLVDELKVLWKDGVRTYDASTGQYFILRACFLWTINDLPAYAIMSGWSTKGYLACPICNEDNSSIRLRSKIGYLGARRFLPEHHIWRRSKLFDGKFEDRTRPLELSGEEILQQINLGTYPPFGKHPNRSRKRKRDEYENNLNWGKKSILFELPYAPFLNLRHSLDPMHIEKNVCDNLVGTSLGIDGKNKDTEKARKDMEDQEIRKELHLKRRANGTFEKPPAKYTLSPKEREGFLDFLKSIKYPDGYAANISKCVNTNGGKLSGLKSHDCHVLLQRILPIGMRGYLNNEIGTALFEFGNFYQQLCSRTVKLSDLDKLQENIVLVLCKLEKILPPAFFDVMVHLSIHLPREVRLGGPVQYRWMYPIERLLGVLKRFVTNKARPEGSIVEAYISKECTTFCSMYLDGIETEFNRVERNDDGGERTLGLAAFNQNVRPFGRIQRAPNVPVNQRDMAHWIHKTLLEADNTIDIAKRQRKEFPQWFKGHMNELQNQGSPEATDELWSLANGPDALIDTYSGCISNGVRFHTIEHDNRHTSQNSGVLVEGEHEQQTIDFYGFLTKVWELRYLFNHRVVLFECEWYNTGSSRTMRVDAHCKSIDTRTRWYKDDSFVLPSQVQQVFYIKDTKFGENWKVVERIQRRGIWNVLEMDSLETGSAPNEVFQQDTTIEVPEIVVEFPTAASSLQRNDIEPAIVNCIMGPGSRKSSASSNSSITSRKMAEIRLGTTATPTSQPEASPSVPPIVASTPSTVPSPSTRTSVATAPPTTQRRVRGPTLGKRVRRLIDGKDGTRLPVYVTQEMRTFCGKNATKVANELGSQIRRMCLPTADSFSHTWSDVPPGQKNAIIQAVRDKFEVTEDNVEFTPLVEEVFKRKASLLYKDWKWRMGDHYQKTKDHYEKTKEEDKNPYQLPFNKDISPDAWKYMIDHIFNDPDWKPRKVAGKKNRNAPVDGYSVASRGHTLGSRSFAATITIEQRCSTSTLLAYKGDGIKFTATKIFRGIRLTGLPMSEFTLSLFGSGYQSSCHFVDHADDKPNGKVLDLCERYQASHTLKDGGWIDPQCEEIHARMVAKRDEASQSGCPLTDEELSRICLGEAKYYVRGFGVGPRPSSFSSQSSSNSARQELQKVQSELELLREERRREREEYERRWEEERNRRDEEQNRRDEEQRQREEQQKQRDEELRLRDEALRLRDEELRLRDEQRQREFDELKAMMMRQMHG